MRDDHFPADQWHQNRGLDRHGHRAAAPGQRERRSAGAQSSTIGRGDPGGDVARSIADADLSRRGERSEVGGALGAVPSNYRCRTQHDC
ncbi:MAG: hypothetical protein ABI345_01610 [Jatrophihabitans sp.]